MKSLRLVAWLPVLLLTALGVLTTWLNRAVQSGGALGPRDPGVPDIVVENIAGVKYNLDGTPRYTLVAKRLEHHPDVDSTVLDDPVLVHYHPDEAEVRVSSRNAYVSQDAAEVIFTGDVHVVRAADEENGPVTLTTTYLRVFPDDGIARTDKEVVITGDDGTLRGVGLEFNNETRQMRLESRVRGEFKNPRATTRQR